MARKSRKKKHEFQSFQAQSKTYQTAIYARLSREAQSVETIETQIEEVQKFMENKPEFRLVDIYQDNGFSGTNFDRPDFERLMEDVRNRKIDCIIVKDLSRFAREHIGAEDYLNNIFPFLGVRFIAINDRYDNINLEPQEYFLASFKLLAHSYFAQETSRKVSMTKHALQEQGKFIGSKIPYGYLRDPNDKHKLIINPDEAEIVRRIFELAADDVIPAEICRILNREDKSGYKWRLYRVWDILNCERYKGVLTQRLSVTAMYKNEEMRRTTKDEQIRIEDAIPAIVSADLWERANRALIDRREKRIAERPENPFQGMVYCYYCHSKVPCGYTKDAQDFCYNCNKCRKGVFTRNTYLKQAVSEYLNLPENTKLTADFLHENFSEILLKSRHDFVFVEVGEKA